ncbi:hypothetical protein [Pedobacter mendelii]|uniref:Uncharacterized protein n=1 Tax=Pedobacter mendelii TaxID=1908240 RepID=A0ABQ2BNP1_9SPHI|nr:hypothetical protein [Pedobacter mendelii]GGI29513.1 hypothetical protein GCM10008119_38000 [Pedobacter mendelii]
MNKQISQALGWAIGVLVVFPLIIYGVNVLFRSKENDGKKYVKKYLESCNSVSTKFPNYSNYKLSYDQYTTSLLSPSETIYKIKFFDSTIKKIAR